MAAMKLCFAVFMTLFAVCLCSPAITTVTPAHLSSTSTTVISISGTSLASITTLNWVKISGLACTGAAVDVNNDVITCTAPAGLGQGNKVQVNFNVGATVTTLTTTANYDVAVNVAASNSDSIINVRAGVTSAVTIVGAGFSSEDHTTGATGYLGLFKLTVGAAPVTSVVEHNDDRIVFEVPHGGAGLNQPVILYLGTQRIVVAGVVVNYPYPAVTDVRQDNAAKRAVGVNVIIIGLNFGNPSPFVQVTATVGNYPCVALVHVSSTQLKCTVVGRGSNHAVVVTVNGASSATAVGAGAPAVRFDFLDAVETGLSCSRPFGATDFFNPSLCNCWSGSAPSNNLLSTDCDLHAVCAGRLITIDVVSESAPSRPVTEFKDDKLHIKQTVAIVRNRRDLNIQFVVPSLTGLTSPLTAAGTIGASTCFYPGTLWEKRINELDCLDEYFGVLPWTQNELCGFVEDKSNVVDVRLRVWKSNLVTSYTETFKRADGSIHFRKISNAYLLTVSFAKQIKALTTTITSIIADETSPVSLDVVVDGDALYDVASKHTIISFQTTIVWPYEIGAYEHVGNWTSATGVTGVVTAKAVPAAVQPGDLSCTQVQDTECEQAWVLTIDTEPFPGTIDQVCNLQGIVTFSTENLVCRDYTTVANCSGLPATKFAISIGNTDLCDSAPDVDGSLGLQATLEPFYDAALLDARPIFQTGDMVYFKVIVTDAVSSIDKITFNSILFKDPTNALTFDTLYAQTVPGAPVSTVTPLAGVDFNITQELRDVVLSPKAEGQLEFRVRLRRDELQVIQLLSTQTALSITQQITVEVTLDIWYHGNQKRSITASSSVPAAAHAQIAFYDVAEDLELEPHRNDAEASFVDDSAFNLFSSASSVVASFAVVAVAALVMA